MGKILFTLGLLYFLAFYEQISEHMMHDVVAGISKPVVFAYDYSLLCFLAINPTQTCKYRHDLMKTGF